MKEQIIKKVKAFFSEEKKVSRAIFSFLLIVSFTLVFGPSIYAQFMRQDGSTGWGYGYGYGYGYGFGSDSGNTYGYKTDFTDSAASAYGFGYGYSYVINDLAAAASSSTAVGLTWSDNSADEIGFKIYRDGSLITTTAANAVSYSDSGLTASTLYSYTIKATNATLDSLISNTATATTSATSSGGGGGGGATTSTSSISINGGAANTTSLNVTLTLSSVNATKMAISNSSDFTGINWETYATSKAWTLLAGPGLKTVYAKFMTASGSVSSVVSDSIAFSATPAVPHPGEGKPATPAVSPAHYADGTLVRGANDSKVYVIKNGKKLWIKSADEFNKAGYKWSDVKVIADDLISAIADYYADGTLLRGANGFKVYVIKGGMKLWIVSGEEFKKGGYKWSNVIVIADDQLSAIADYYADGTLLRGTNDIKVYVIKGGRKLWIISGDEFKKGGYKWSDVKVVEDSTISAFADYVFLLIRGDQDFKVYAIENGNKRHIASAEAFKAGGYKWPDVQVVGMDVINGYADVSSGGSVTVITANLRVRNASSTKGKALGYVKKGEVYTILAEDNGWYKVSTKAGIGWISGQYATKN